MNSGRPLEEAVKAIETAILQGQALGERVLEIEARKLLTIDGVRHEIDVFVQIKHRGKYDSTYIFECKDHANPIGKNDIIVFSEKIRACGATRGFFVAPAFSEFARAQAKLDSRMVLLSSAEHKISPVGFRCIGWTNPTYRWPEVLTGAGPVVLRLATPIIAAGKTLLFAAWLEEIGERAIRTRIAQPDVSALADGEHRLSARVTYNLPKDGVVVEGAALTNITIQADFTYRVHTPKLLYGYDVKTRGTYLRFERFQFDEHHGIDGLTITGTESPQ